MSTPRGTPGAGLLAATTARLAGQGTGIDATDVDLLAAAGSDGIVWQHEGFGLAGRGVALRIELPRGLTDAAAVADGVAAGTGLRSEDVAEAVLYMLTRPRHVNIRDLVLLPVNQEI